jgi:hypothetical protein
VAAGAEKRFFGVPVIHRTLDPVTYRMPREFHEAMVGSTPHQPIIKAMPTNVTPSRTLLRHSYGRFFIGAIVALFALAALWMVIAWNWNYSEGERAGWVQKFSKKGWVCKTWEGEIALVSMPGAIPEKFEFTVFDDAVAEKINRYMGQRVALTYAQKVGLPTSCFGDTRYYVSAVVPVNELQSYPGVIPVPAAPAPVTAAPSVLAPMPAQAPAVTTTPGLPSAPAPMPAPSAVPAVPVAPGATSGGVVATQPATKP